MCKLRAVNTPLNTTSINYIVYYRYSVIDRVRLVGGTIVIDSKELAGTTIHVRVPLGAERDSQGAAG